MGNVSFVGSLTVLGLGMERSCWTMGKRLLVDKSRLRLYGLGLSNPVMLSSRSLGVER